MQSRTVRANDVTRTPLRCTGSSPSTTCLRTCFVEPMRCEEVVVTCMVPRSSSDIGRPCIAAAGIEAKCPLGMDLLDCLERTYGLISFRESLPVPFACVNARSRFDELALCYTVPCAALQRRIARDEESAVPLGAAKQCFQAAVGCSAHMRPLANGAFAREAIVSRPMSTREKRKEAVNQRAQLQPRPLKAFGVASRSVRLAGKASGRNVLASCQILE